MYLLPSEELNFYPRLIYRYIRGILLNDSNKCKSRYAKILLYLVTSNCEFALDRE